MDLVGRLEGFYTRAKQLALAGILGANLAYNSGCEALVLGGAHVWAAEKQAQATRDAARIQAGGEKNKNDYRIQTLDQNIFLTCNDAEDRDGDKLLDRKKEIYGEKDQFSLGEKITFLAQIRNKKGSYLSFELYQVVNNKKRKLNNDGEYLINADSIVLKKKYLDGLPRSMYIGVWKVDGEQVGTNVINSGDI